MISAISKYNHYFQLRGRRPTTTIISYDMESILTIYVLAYVGKISLIYQVTDNRTVTHQKHPLYKLGYFSLYFIWKSKVVVLTTRIVVSVFHRLVVTGTTETHWFDGPGFHSTDFYLQNYMVYMSTFQAFAAIYVENRKGSYKLFKYYKYEQYELRYYAISVDIKNIPIYEKGNTVLPPCMTESPKVFQVLDDTKNKILQPKSNNFHCMYHLTSKSGFVNLSITKMTYSGPDFTEPSFQGCLHGGVAYNTGRSEHANNPPFDYSFWVKGGPHVTEIQYLCDNYSSVMNENDTLQKVLMNIVSHTQDGLLMVVYSYQNYSHISIEASATSTPCQGIPYYKSKLFICRILNNFM